MGIDVSLLLEARGPDGRWRSETEQHQLGQLRHGGVVQVAWWSSKQRDHRIMLGTDSPFQKRPGVPADASQQIRAAVTPNLLDYPQFAGWFMLSDLMLPLWPTTSVLMTGKVPAASASWFMDGDQPFPDRELASGLVWNELHRTAQPTTQPAVWSERPWELQRHARDYLIEVTWTEPIADAAPAAWNGLQRLVDLENDDDFRLIVGVG